LGVLLAGFVVTPRLNRRLTKQRGKKIVVYFGHCALLEIGIALKEKLRSLDADEELGHACHSAYRYLEDRMVQSTVCYSHPCFSLAIGVWCW